MAKKGTNPYSKVMGRNVFPVVPIKNELVTVADNTPVYEEVELNLQFENSEVFDIVKWETWVDPASVAANPAAGAMDIDYALLDDPAEATLNINTAASFQDTNKIIAYGHTSWQYFEDAAPVSHSFIQTVHHETHVFEEPFTVARNISITLVQNRTADFFGDVVTLRSVLWGRRRRASESEFKDIVYRERF